MDKNSLLYQLMALRMNSVMNDVAERDEDYQASLSAVDPYIEQLKALQLPKETRKLIDDCVSGHVAIGSCLERLAYMQGFSDCRELLLKPFPKKKGIQDAVDLTVQPVCLLQHFFQVFHVVSPPVLFPMLLLFI